jgi:hypothetical protein
MSFEFVSVDEGTVLVCGLIFVAPVEEQNDSRNQFHFESQAHTLLLCLSFSH